MYPIRVPPSCPFPGHGMHSLYSPQVPVCFSNLIAADGSVSLVADEAKLLGATLARFIERFTLKEARTKDLLIFLDTYSCTSFPSVFRSCLPATVYFSPMQIFSMLEKRYVVVPLLSSHSDDIFEYATGIVYPLRAKYVRNLRI